MRTEDGWKISRWRKLKNLIPPFGPVPVRAVEAVAMRFLFALLIMVTLPSLAACTTAPFPIGIGRLTDLTWMAEPLVEKMLRSLVAVLLIFYVACQRQVVISLALGTLLVMFDTLYNSAGAVGHSRQMVSLILFAQAASSIRLGQSDMDSLVLARARWLWFTKIAFASVYLISVGSKLAKSGGSWLWDAHLFAWDIVRVNRQNFYNALDPMLDGIPETAQWIAAHPFLSTALFDLGLVVELSVVLLLLRSRLIALIVGIACIALHVGIAQVMGLSFPIFIACAFIFMVNPVGWIIELVEAVNRKVSGAEAK